MNANVLQINDIATMKGEKKQEYKTDLSAKKAWRANSQPSMDSLR